MSKLEELMALADAFWEHGTNEALAHAEGAGYDGERVNAARAALQDALKAVVEDAERLDWIQTVADARRIEIAKSLFGGGYEIGEWPSMRVTVKIGSLRDAIDAARKP